MTIVLRHNKDSIQILYIYHPIRNLIPIPSKDDFSFLFFCDTIPLIIHFQYILSSLLTLRLSLFFLFHFDNVTVDTMCVSSLELVVVVNNISPGFTTLPIKATSGRERERDQGGDVTL